ncbi:MAG: hypothetical protein NDJ89_18065 [Oligoflexia bacterium]|nr:hypothetical protein [Oligoflexia bacterium]
MLKALIDQDDARAVLAKRFAFSAMIAHKDEKISIQELGSHSFAHQHREPIKPGSQINVL